MADGLEIKIEGLDGTIKRLSPEEAIRGLRTGMEKATISVRREYTKNLSGRILKVHTDFLRSGVTHGIEVEGNQIIGFVGNNARVKSRIRDWNLAAIHEYGANIDHPGGTHYFVVPGAGQNKAVFVTKQVGEILGLPVTRPHKIKIPARKPLELAMNAKKVEVLNIIRTSLIRRLVGDPEPGLASEVFR